MSRTPPCKTDTADVAVDLSLSPSFKRLPLKFMALTRLVFCFALILFAVTSKSDETNATPPASGRLDETNAQETLRAYLQLQEQLHQTQLAIEQNRKEARESAAQSAEILTERLQMIERALSAPNEWSHTCRR